MKVILSKQHQAIHNTAVALSARHAQCEIDLILILETVMMEKIDRLLGFSNLYGYAIEALSLSESNAHTFIAVMKKCSALPVVKDAVVGRSVTISKLARLVSVLTPQNASELMDFAGAHSKRQIEHEVARLNPRAKVHDRVRPLSADWSELKCSISPKVARMLERSQSVMATKRQRSVDLNETMEIALELLLQKHDPVVKAEGAEARRSKAANARETAASVGKNTGHDCEADNERHAQDSSQVLEKVCPGRKSADVSLENARKPLSAAQKHRVQLRDKGQCTFIIPATGKRCGNDRWLETHHIQLVSEGGSNDPENLTTLCAAHHDLVHQLSLPLERQITYLRSPQVRYG